MIYKIKNKKCIKREKMVKKKKANHFEWVQLMDINDAWVMEIAT